MAVFSGGCSTPEKVPEPKVWAWLAGSLDMSDEDWDYYFSKARQVGIDAILLQVHGGYPKVGADETDLTDREALEILKRAVPYAERYGIELHAWIWTLNRCEKNLRKMHPDWYQVNAEGNSCLDIKLYNREHYRWLCPSHPEVTEYLKARVAELADVDGVAGVHLDFIRYPDAILPYGLHESRGVVQDRVYPQWDHCYCETCREKFMAQGGADPMTLEDPTSCEEWMQFRWDAVVDLTNALCDEIHKHGKMATAAVFASPAESRKLVRQDWSRFVEADVLFPMIYHKFYNYDDPWVETATREGVEEMAANGCKGKLCSGLFVGHVSKDNIDQLIGYAVTGGSDGICFFSLNVMEETDGYWDAFAAAIERFKKGELEVKHSSVAGYSKPF